MVTENIPTYLEERVYLPDRTLSSLISPQGGLICKILERAWVNNQRSISCIPEGKYLVTWSPPVLQDDPTTEIDESGGRHTRPYEHYIIHDVPGRSGILMHAGTDVDDSEGCQLVGSRFRDVNTPKPSLSESRVKLAWMTANLPKKFWLLIEPKSGIPYK
jgi:hypothetical protein